MRLFARSGALPPTPFGYRPPAGAVALRWICTADGCGSGGPDREGRPWPRRCPGCQGATVATHELAEPWQHAAKRVEIDARLNGLPQYGDPAAARADDLLWQVEDALLAGQAERAERTRRQFDALVAELTTAATGARTGFSGYLPRFWLVTGALRHGAHGLAARELRTWHAARTFDNPEGNDERADCRTLADLLITFLEAPATAGSPHRDELWACLRDLMPRIEQVATASNILGSNRLLRHFSGGNREEELMIAELKRLAAADRADGTAWDGSGPGSGSGLPAQTARRLEILGGVKIAGPDSGVDGTLVWDVCLAPFLPVAPEALAEAVLPVGGWSVYGASRCLQELRAHDAASPAYLALLDAGLRFLHDSGLGPGHLNGWDHTCWTEIHGPGSW